MTLNTRALLPLASADPERPPGGPIIRGDTLGQRIASGFDQTGLSTNEIARRMGSRWQTIKRWASDDLEPKATTVVRIAQVCETTPGALYGCYQEPKALIEFLAAEGKSLPEPVRETLLSMTWQGIEPDVQAYKELAKALTKAHGKSKKKKR